MLQFSSTPTTRDKYLTLPLSLSPKLQCSEDYLLEDNTFLVVYNDDSSISVISLKLFEECLAMKNGLSQHFLISNMKSGEIDNFRFSSKTKKNQIRLYHQSFFPETRKVKIKFLTSFYGVNEVIKELMQSAIWLKNIQLT